MSRVVSPLPFFMDGVMAFGTGSPLREELNRAVLQLREDDAYGSLYAQWFGDE